MIVGFFPDNIFESLANGMMMQITVFALIFGAALSLFRSEKDFKFVNLLDEFNRIILEIIRIVMKIAPIGVFVTVDYSTGMLKTMANVHIDATAGMIAAHSMGELDPEILSQRKEVSD